MTGNIFTEAGSAWIGQLPQRWSLRKLKYLASLRDRKVPATGVAYLGLENIEPWTGRLVDTEAEAAEGVGNVFLSGDVLFGKLRPYLAKAHQALQGGLCSTEFLVLTPRDLHPRFLLYCLLSEGFISAVNASTYGAKMPRANWRDTGSLPLPHPPVGDQESIGTFLDAKTAEIDALIAKKQRLIELLLEKRAAQVSHAVNVGLCPKILLRDSGTRWFRWIPEHWEVRRLRHLTPRLGVGVVVNPSNYIADEGLPFLYGSDIEEGRIRADQARRISAENSRGLPASQLHAGDLVMVRVGAPGITAVVPPELEGSNCASVLVIRKGRLFDSSWLCYALNSRQVRSQVEVVQYGAAQKQFNVSHAVNFILAVPPVSEQQEIARYLNEVTGQIDALVSRVRLAIDRLREYRTALISAAVTGKIDVRSYQTTPCQ